MQFILDENVPDSRIIRKDTYDDANLKIIEKLEEILRCACLSCKAQKRCENNHEVYVDNDGVPHITLKRVLKKCLLIKLAGFIDNEKPLPENLIIKSKEKVLEEYFHAVLYSNVIEKGWNIGE